MTHPAMLLCPFGIADLWMRQEGLKNILCKMYQSDKVR